MIYINYLNYFYSWEKFSWKIKKGNVQRMRGLNFFYQNVIWREKYFLKYIFKSTEIQSEEKISLHLWLFK